MIGHDYAIIIAFFLKHELYWAYIPSILFDIQFVIKKTSCLQVKRLRKKIRFLNIMLLAPKNNKEDMRLIDKKSFNSVRYWEEKPKDLKCIW